MVKMNKTALVVALCLSIDGFNLLKLEFLIGGALYCIFFLVRSPEPFKQTS